jgi:GNAT superfamily N-acetyltransferase
VNAVRDNDPPRVVDKVERVGLFVDRHDLKVGRARVHFYVDHDRRLVDIASIRVPRAARGKGEAARALRYVLGIADRLGYDTQLGASPLDARTSLGRLVRFYQAHGFELTGQSINPLGHPRMRRPAQRDRRRFSRR